MAKEYTDIWNGFQFRSPTYLDGHFEPHEFDLVKWNEQKTNCFSIATLIWDSKEEWFKFKSVGTRFLEYRENRLEEWIMKFCEFKTIELRED